ncbi:hypothetical protein [Methylobacter sp.]|uniref:hypothetical protein n=1 Tax=Methylobacter sp. TaxID=2051955 RepID=UPI002FDF239E
MKVDFITKVEFAIFVLGVLLAILGININTKLNETILLFERTILQNILISVGTSIVASSIISYITTLYLSADKEARSVIETWGLKNIDIRTALNSEINKNLDDMSQGMDIIAFGMKNFLAAKGSLLEEKVKQGRIIRILTMDPDSKFLVRREEEEGNVPGQIRNEIEDMIHWVQGINGQNFNGSIEIRSYNGLPQDMYQRIDGHVYVGSLHYRKPSQQTITYEYKPGSKGAEYYTKYFLDLWKDDSFSKEIL